MRARAGQRRQGASRGGSSGPGKRPSVPWRELLPWLAVLLAVVTYAGALRYSFVYDDTAIFEQPRPTWRLLPQQFLHGVFSQAGKKASSNYYRPLSNVLITLDYECFGEDPAGYHATAIGIHALVTLLVYLLAVRTFKERTTAGFAALIFAVHPLHVESVAWISCVTETECALFFLAAMLGYLRWRESTDSRFTIYDLRSGRKGTAPLERRDGNLDTADGEPDIANRKSQIVNRKWLFLSLVCYALSLLSKETGMVLCAMIFVYEWRRQRARGTASREEAAAAGGSRPPGGPVRPAWLAQLGRSALATLPYLALTAVYLAVRAYALRGFTPVRLSRAPLSAVLLSLPAVLWFYLRKLVWILPVSEFYPLRLGSQAAAPDFFLPLALSLASLACLWYWSRKSETAAVASAWLLLPLAPPVLAISRLVPYDLVHDRYLYLPSVGLVLLMALAIGRWKGSRRLSAEDGAPGRRRPAGRPGPDRERRELPDGRQPGVFQLVCVLLLVCALGGITVSQARYWSSEHELYRHGVEVAPHNPLPLTQWAIIVGKELQDPQGARRLAELALAEAPDDFLTLLTAGMMRRNARDYDGAVPVLLRAQELRPEEPGPRFFLGLAYLGKGQLAAAEAELRQAILLRPAEPEQHFVLGDVLQQQGRLEEARQEFLAELQVNPASRMAAARLAALSR
jgi:hypothetical protein